MYSVGVHDYKIDETFGILLSAYQVCFLMQMHKMEKKCVYNPL